MSRPDSHETFSRDEVIKTSSDRAFGLVFAGVFALIGLWPLIGAGEARWWSLALGALFAAIAMLRPGVLAPLNRAWTRFGLVLNRVVSPVVMGLLFFAVVTPTGLLMRALGKDPLRLKIDRGAETYWIERRPPGPAPDTMRQQF